MLLQQDKSVFEFYKLSEEEQQRRIQEMRQQGVIGDER